MAKHIKVHLNNGRIESFNSSYHILRLIDNCVIICNTVSGIQTDTKAIYPIANVNFVKVVDDTDRETKP